MNAQCVKTCSHTVYSILYPSKFFSVNSQARCQPPRSFDINAGKQQDQSLKVLAKGGYYGCILVAAGDKGTGILTMLTR
jgi:hypothetical protein